MCELFPEKTVWSYTGFLWEEVKDDEGVDYSDPKELKKIRNNAKVKGVVLEDVYTKSKEEVYADKENEDLRSHYQSI